MAIPLRLNVLGGCTLIDHGCALHSPVAQRKPLVLLAILAAVGDRGISRDKLLGLMWPGSDEPRARGALKQTLYMLRRKTGRHGLVSGTATLRLDPVCCNSDVREFRQALDCGRLAEAVALYAGPFLDGVYTDDSAELDRWIEGERSRLASGYRDSLRSLAAQAQSAGNSQAAVRWWEALARLDPFDSAAAYALVRALLNAGNTSAAVRHAQIHQRIVRDELDSEPDPAIQRLVDAALGGHNPQPALATQLTAPAQTPAPEATAPLPRSNVLDGTLGVAARLPVQAATPRRLGGRVQALLFGAAVVAIAAIGSALTLRKPNDLSDRPRVAVVPLTNLTGDTSVTPTGWVVADWISRSLAGSRLVRVVDLPAFFVGGSTPDGRPTDAREYGRRNGAQLAVAGSLQLRGDTIECLLRILNTEDGVIVRALAPMRLSWPLLRGDYVRIGSQVATAVATLVDARYEQLTDAGAHIPAPAAYAAFVLAQRHFWTDRGDSAEIEFRSALRSDSAFLSPVAWLATLFANRAECLAQDSMVTALGDGIQRMAEFDVVILRRQMARCRGDQAEVLRLARVTTRLRPESPFAWAVLGGYALGSGRAKEARDALLRINPDVDLGWDASPGHAPYYLHLAEAYHSLGDHPAELRSIERYWRSGGRRGSYLLALAARAEIAMGRVSEALRYVEEVRMASGDTIPDGSLGGGWEFCPGGLHLWLASEFIVHGYRAEAQRIASDGLAAFAGAPCIYDYPVQRVNGIRLLDLLGKGSEALDLAEAAVRDRPLDWVARAELSLQQVKGGQLKVALASGVGLPAIKVAGCEGGPDFMRARIYAAAGFKDSAVVALFRTDGLRVERCYSSRRLAHMEPEFMRLRGYPPFERFMRPED